MFVKIVIIAIVAFFATCEGTEVWDGLVAKWDEGIKNGFYSLPQTLEDAVNGGWTKIEGSIVPEDATPMGYHGDPTLVLLYNPSGEIIGFQGGYSKAANDEIGNYVTMDGLYVRNLNGEDYYTSTVLFKNDKETGAHKIFIYVNGEWEEFPTNTHALVAEKGYHVNRCVLWMGTHYYRINAGSDCSELFPWAFLKGEEGVIGMIFQVLLVTTPGTDRTWTETLPIHQLAYGIPDAPQCFLDNFYEYGYNTIHIWFKQDPLATYCVDECTPKYDVAAWDMVYTEPTLRNGSYVRTAGNFCPI